MVYMLATHNKAVAFLWRQEAVSIVLVSFSHGSFQHPLFPDLDEHFCTSREA